MTRFWRLLAAVCVLALPAIAPTNAMAQATCPANAHVVNVDVSGDVRTTTCHCDAGYKNTGGVCAPDQTSVVPAPDSNCPDLTGDINSVEATDQSSSGGACKRVCKQGFTARRAVNPNGYVCSLDTVMRPAPTTEEQIATLKRQAAQELSESKYHNMKVYFAGLKAIFAPPDEQEPDAEEEFARSGRAFREIHRTAKGNCRAEGLQAGRAVLGSAGERSLYPRARQFAASGYAGHDERHSNDSHFAAAITARFDRLTPDRNPALPIVRFCLSSNLLG